MCGKNELYVTRAFLKQFTVTPLVKKTAGLYEK
jgi:hypothetical protein